MRVLRSIRDGYVGLAPVPGGRLNIGIVLGPSWRGGLARDGAAVTTRRALAMVPTTADDPIAWAEAMPCERIAGAVPLGGRVTRRAGPGWFLVGDAAGFLDPFTGEGLHRALVSTELAATAIQAALGRTDGAPTGRRPPPRTTARCAAGSPRRTPSRGSSSRSSPGPACSSTPHGDSPTGPNLRATMGLVMGDLVPASRGLDPRFLAALLAP